MYQRLTQGIQSIFELNRQVEITCKKINFVLTKIQFDIIYILWCHISRFKYFKTKYLKYECVQYKKRNELLMRSLSKKAYYTRYSKISKLMLTGYCNY